MLGYMANHDLRTVLRPLQRPATATARNYIGYVNTLGTKINLHYYILRLTAGRSGDRIPVGGEIFRTRPDRPRGPSSLLYNG
jgi:putative component of toxin-antitoxin plasmid stabilization module